IALVDQRVEAGDVVGTMGLVRRGPEQGPELHFEMFSATRLTGALGRAFRFVEAAADGPFVRRGAIVEAVGAVGADELREFFRQGDLDKRQALRRLAIRHQHEWGDHIGERDFVAARELGGWSERDRRRLYDVAIAPY